MLLFFALLLPISMVAMEQNNGVFSFKLQDVTVKDIFKYIEKNSEYIFLYSTDKNLLKKINVDVNKKDITQVLDEILKNTTLIYDIDGKQIIIREKNASEKSQQKTTQKKKTIRGIVSDDSTQEPIIGGTHDVVVLCHRTAEGLIAYRNGRGAEDHPCQHQDGGQFLAQRKAYPSLQS